MSPMISESWDDSEAVGPEHVTEEIPVNVNLPDADGVGTKFTGATLP